MVQHYANFRIAHLKDSAGISNVIAERLVVDCSCRYIKKEVDGMM